MFSIIHNKTILVVDDDANNRELIINALFNVSPQTKVLSAAHGAQALQILQNREVHLVLLDWEMPVLDGYQTLLQIKNSPVWQRIPVVIYTGIMTDLDSLQQALEIGAADFLRKPTDPVEIIARIRAILRQEEYYKSHLQSQREKYEAQISEMSTIALHLQQQEHLIEQMRDNLQQTLKSLNPQEGIKKLLKTLNHTDISDEDWTRYKMRIDAMQNGFLEKLFQKHSDLSRQQLTLCSLFRSGLASKEVAQILNMSMDALDKNRYRIRKKIGLEPSESLENYLIQL